MAKIIFERNIEIPMRDGCVLRGDLFRPDTPEKLPVIINRTPYNKAMPMVFALTMDSIRAASAGYNVLIQDCRGRFASDGVFNCFTDEARDGYDTVEWAARQPWSNGNIGMYGASYMGATQWLAATTAPPQSEVHRAVITASDYHDGWTYQGGAFSLFFNVSWTMGALAPARLLREREQTVRRALVERIRRDDRIDRSDARENGVSSAARLPDVPQRRAVLFRLAGASQLRRTTGKALSIEEHHNKITVPALNIGGWYDIFQGGTIRNYTGMRESGGNDAARRGQRLVHRPVASCGPAQPIWSAASTSVWRRVRFPSTSMASSFDGSTIGSRAPAMASTRRRRCASSRWASISGATKKTGRCRAPIFAASICTAVAAQTASRRRRAFDRASRRRTGGRISLQSARSRRRPIGGGLCCYPGALQGGAWDQREAEARADVLIYSTDAARRKISKSPARCGWCSTHRPRRPTPTSPRSWSM